MHVEPQKEHKWLEKLLGDWTTDTETLMGPDKPAEHHEGTATTRSLGGLWVVTDGDGCGGKYIVTLGFDPALNAFVGTWVGGMMPKLWHYIGALNAEETILTLESEGPNFTDGSITKYHDIIEIVSPDHWILRSQVLGEDGAWFPFMAAHHRRK